MKLKALNTQAILNELKLEYNDISNTQDKIAYLEILRKSINSYKDARDNQYQFSSYTPKQNSLHINNTIQAINLMIKQITLDLYNY